MFTLQCMPVLENIWGNILIKQRHLEKTYISLAWPAAWEHNVLTCYNCCAPSGCASSNYQPFKLKQFNRRKNYINYKTCLSEGLSRLHRRYVPQSHRPMHILSEMGSSTSMPLKKYVSLCILGRGPEHFANPALHETPPVAGLAERSPTWDHDVPIFPTAQPNTRLHSKLLPCP